MKHFIPLFLLLLITSCSKESLPPPDRYQDCRPQVSPLDQSKADPETGLIEFDIIPDMVSDNSHRAPVLTQKDRLWKDATIAWYIQPDIKMPSGGVMYGFTREDQKIKIRTTIKEFEAQTGIKMPEYETREALHAAGHQDGVAILKGAFQSSAHLGRQGSVQPIQLATSLDPGDIKHEIMHTLGIGHMFNRSDRDDHVIILFENINEHNHRQFEINPLTVDCGEFDLLSVMMYGTYQYSEDKAIMVTVDGEEFERQPDMSRNDINVIKAMYNLN